MSNYDRREFLGKVGVGMLVSAGAWTVASEFDLVGLVYGDEPGRIDFGKLEPLVSLMQETAADALLPQLKTRLDAGVDLPTLATAAALANARTFGGQDYTGYHCFMAIVPALAMSRKLSGNEAALPVFKVLHRNARRIQDQGGRRHEVLRPVQPVASLDGEARAQAEDLVDGSLLPQEALEVRQKRRQIQACLRSLAPKERAAFVLRDLEGLDTRTVARALRVSQVTVRRHASNARRKIRARLERQFPDLFEGDA